MVECLEAQKPFKYLISPQFPSFSPHFSLFHYNCPYFPFNCREFPLIFSFSILIATISPSIKGAGIGLDSGPHDAIFKAFNKLLKLFWAGFGGCWPF